MSETARRMCSWFLTFLIALSVMLPSALDVAYAQDPFVETAYAQTSDGGLENVSIFSFSVSHDKVESITRD